VFPESTPNIKLCYWDRPGTQRQWKSGQDSDCNVCTGERTESVTITKKTSAAINDDCLPPQ
jgi:hypothetical protein